jgi:hypothetical protein
MGTHSLDRYIVAISVTYLVTIITDYHLQYSACNKVTVATQLLKTSNDVTFTIFGGSKKR